MSNFNAIVPAPVLRSTKRAPASWEMVTFCGPPRVGVAVGVLVGVVVGVSVGVLV